MPDCLIALGSNLGNRCEQLRQALSAIGILPATRLIGRSGWHETVPIGGPQNQGSFLNAAALVSTALPPSRLLSELKRIETGAGREGAARWAPRPLDLDVAIYGDVRLHAGDLILPHPRLTFRRFMLEPAAEIAPWMLHGECGWTLQRLLAHLNTAQETVVVAASGDQQSAQLIDGLSKSFGFATDVRPDDSNEKPSISLWAPAGSGLQRRPKLILAVQPLAGTGPDDWRRMLQLPAMGPIAWVGAVAGLDTFDEAVAAVQAVWPSLIDSKHPAV
jgi:2-amino-4-hydroxy-6-hydroxymethyldihydropteridine diphosphokinase